MKQPEAHHRDDSEPLPTPFRGRLLAARRWIVPDPRTLMSSILCTKKVTYRLPEETFLGLIEVKSLARPSAIAPCPVVSRKISSSP